MGLSWSFNLREIVEYYILYTRVMQHWKSELPLNRILTVKYEDMIYDQESTVQLLLKHLDLPWDENVLHFYDTERYVNTMSAAQVSSIKKKLIHIHIEYVIILKILLLFHISKITL